jgi:flagellar export protein FliJ
MRKNKTISKILKLKENKKIELELEVKRASDRADKEKSKLQALEKDYSDTLQFFSEKHEEGSLNVNKINSYYDFFSRINGKISEQKKIHSQRQNELKSLKDTLVNAHKEKKVIEIMNDKLVKRELREKVVSEQKETDFLTISRKLR